MATTAVHSVTFRTAGRADLAAIITMLADDDVSRTRSGYTAVVTDEIVAAFEEISRDPSNELELDRKNVVPAVNLERLEH